MKRRRLLHLLGGTAGALVLSPADLIFPGTETLAHISTDEASAALEALRREAPCRAAVRTERGAPACPYTYQNTNDPDKARWESDLYDGAGNWLGRARRWRAGRRCTWARPRCP